MNAPVTRSASFTGWHMIALMVTFFGVVFGVNIFMAMSALRTWTGLVVENSYVASQEFNTKLTIARDRTAIGWRGGLDYIGNSLIFSLTDAAGRAILLDAVVIEVNRPVGIKGDQTLELSRADDGTWQVPLQLDSGVWNAEIVAGIAGEPDYEHHARLIVGQ